MGPKKIRMAIGSELSHVFMVGLAVNGICRHVGFTPLTSHQIEICVVEAVNNAIKHAHTDCPENQVDVDLSLYSDRMEFCIHDQGRAMEKLEKPVLDFDPEDLENLPEGGMGLFIIHQIMDEVRYESGGNENALTMVKKLPPKK